MVLLSCREERLGEGEKEMMTVSDWLTERGGVFDRVPERNEEN